MSKKSKRFEADLDRLITQGELLHDTLQHEFLRHEFDKMLAASFSKKAGKKYVDNLPDFQSAYQAWYSEALALVKQTLPDRHKDFVSYYEYPRVRKNLDFGNYRIMDYLQGVVSSRGTGPYKKIIVDGSAALLAFRQQLAIVKAARATLASTLLELTTILQADLFDSETDSAEALANAGFLRAAGAVCGVVIEKHLQQVCANHNVKLGRKKITIAVLNDALKDSQVLSIPDWRFVQHLGDIRNLCDHAKTQEPTKDQINDLVAGTRKILTTVF